MMDIQRLKSERADTQKWLKIMFTSVCIADGRLGLNGRKSRRCTARTEEREWTVNRMRLIDADHLKKWIINRGLQYPLKTIDILDQIDRELTFLEDRKQGEWTPVSERLPEEAYPVIVTWKNDDPASYYQYILGKHYAGVAHYKNGKWYWYSSITEDMLMEYGRCDSEEFDEAIKVIAWMPLPEPYKDGEEDG